jgi:RNA polymerase sigma-70 factor (family 1)
LKASKEYIAHLLHRLSQTGDEKAFELLFKLFYERLLHFSLLYVHTPEIAEEVISDVFVKVWNNRGNLAQIANLETYLFVAVKNQSLNCVSGLSGFFVSAATVLPLDSLVDTFDPGKELELRELQFDIEKAVARLPTQCKVVFKLIKEDGFKYKEAAEILNLSVRTVETQLARALNKLSVALDPYLTARKDKQKSSRLPLIICLPFSFLFS